MSNLKSSMVINKLINQSTNQSIFHGKRYLYHGNQQTLQISAVFPEELGDKHLPAHQL